MSKADALKGVMKTLVWLTREEFGEMDHKLYRLGFSITIFVLAGLFWFYFIRNVLPTPF